MQKLSIVLLLNKLIKRKKTNAKTNKRKGNKTN